MPMFEFICEACEHEFEELVSTADELAPCPKCNSDRVSRVLSAFAFKSGDTFRSSSSHGGCSGCHSGGCGSCGCKH